MKPRLVLHSKDIDGQGNIVEIKIWRVPPSSEKPHGFKYSLVYIVDGKRVVGYDNAEGKGDHRHFYGKEETYSFTTVRKLMADFRKDIQRSAKQ